MTLNCPDCGQKAALVKVSIFVDPHDTSIESMTPQVAKLLGMQPADFSDEADVVCTACEAETPYKWALAATHRADSHEEAKKDVEAYEYALRNITLAWKQFRGGFVDDRVDDTIKLLDELLPWEHDVQRYARLKGTSLKGDNLLDLTEEE